MKRDQSFATTRWSLIAMAGGAASPEAREALESLCDTYWYPLYAYIRRRGFQAAEAQDLTQSFFVTLFEKDRLQLADQDRGRFRSFLLSSLNHFIANQWRHCQAEKRGGGKKVDSLDFRAGETRYGYIPSDDTTPEKLFDRKWALTLIESAVTTVENEYDAAGKSKLFELLKGHLGGDADSIPHRQIAEQLETTPGAVKVAAYRLRQRCRQVLRTEIGRTVSDEAQIDEELRDLFGAVVVTRPTRSPTSFSAGKES